MELAEGVSTCTLYCHSLLHTWGLSRLFVHTSDEAGESNLRLSKRFACVTSTLPNESIRECLTHELYMKLVHTSATWHQGRLWRPERRPIILEPCFFGAGTAWRKGMVHVLTLWMAIPEATLYMDEGTHSLKLGLPGVKGRSDIRSVCGHCAQALSHTRHWKPFDMTTFQGCPWSRTHQIASFSLVRRGKRQRWTSVAVGVSHPSHLMLISARLHQKQTFGGDAETLVASAVWL